MSAPIVEPGEPSNEKPPALTGGEVVDGRKASTLEFYSIDHVLGVVRGKLKALAIVADEVGILAGRADEVFRGPAIPEAVWRVAWAHSLTVAGAIYSTSPANRARRARLLRELFAEAESVRAELGGAA